MSVALSAELQSSPTPDDLNRTSIAIRRSFIVEKIERSRRSSKRLGFAHVDYGRLFIRDRNTLFAIARELNCTIEELLSPVEPTRESRIVWSDIVGASESILASVRALLEPIRSIVVDHGLGLNWRTIRRKYPDRMAWSLHDDHEAGMVQILQNRSSEVHLIATSDHQKFFVVKRQK